MLELQIRTLGSLKVHMTVWLRDRTDCPILGPNIVMCIFVMKVSRLWCRSSFGSHQAVRVIGWCSRPYVVLEPTDYVHLQWFQCWLHIVNFVLQ